MSPDWREQHFGPAAKPVQQPSRRRWPLLVLLATAAAGYGGYYFRDHLPSLSPTAWTQMPGTAADDGPLTITQARANELQRLIESRERGLDLLHRDHAKVAAAFASAENTYKAARARLASLDASKPTASSNEAFYRWSVERNDAAAAMSNATVEYKRQKSLDDGFRQRIAKAEKERDEAQRILDTHRITDATPHD